ncbi:MAG: tryptophan synthase subunit alpha [Candidatus Omnitrophica bacterium]|nr:tryptophan synthase subunit alpha [Candidatus Omnitrophota bacterium]
MSRLTSAFRNLKKKKAKAFIAFITAGFPSLAATAKLIPELEKAGADIIELGVPFSDPMADGPIIQYASQEALKKGVTLDKILSLVKKARMHTDIPICLMTYYNPVLSFGEERFVKKAVSAGVDGLILPDLPPEEGALLRKAADTHGLDIISFIAPTTPPERLRFIARAARGFIYYLSLTGVTGPRQGIAGDLASNVRRIKKVTHKPVCVGFGVSSRAQVAGIQKSSDGVIVGSAIVRKIREYKDDPLLAAKVAQFVRSLKGRSA